MPQQAAKNGSRWAYILASLVVSGSLGLAAWAMSRSVVHGERLSANVERLRSLENKYTDIHEELKDIRADIKVLLKAQSQAQSRAQSGAGNGE